MSLYSNLRDIRYCYNIMFGKNESRYIFKIIYKKLSVIKLNMRIFI